MRVRVLMPAALAALLLAACGQKGPLRLPDKNAKVTTSPAAPAPPAPADTGAAPAQNQAPASKPKPENKDDPDSQPPR